MNTREVLYYAALLQETGVLAERAGLSSWRSAEPSATGKAAPATPSNRRQLAAELVRRCASRIPVLASLPELPALVGGSAAPSVATRLLRLAEFCSSPGTGGGRDGTRGRADVAAESPLGRVVVTRGPRSLAAKTPLRIRTGPLSVERACLFPNGNDAGPGPQRYRALAEGLLHDLERVDDEAGLFAALEKHLHSVPLSAAAPDVSAFDFARTTAALALCLWDEHEQGGWRGREREVETGAYALLPAPCLLVSGGLSGIQDFIFDVPSRRASKSLKGRSHFVQLAADVCARHLAAGLGLKEASVLYNGGGNFFLLAPACRVERLEELRREMGAALLPESLSLALGWAPVHVRDLVEGGFGACWKAAHAAAELRKRRRFQELGVRVFAPFAQKPRDEEGDSDPFARMTEQLSRASGLEIRPARAAAGDGPGSVLARLGVEVRYATGESDPRATAFNRTDFAGRFRDFRFAVKDLPRYTDELVRRLYPEGSPPDEAEAGKLLDFRHMALLAAERTGTPKLGVLKMDVDNLGEIFVRGLPEPQRTVTRMAALSRTMKWFFEGYLNDVLGRGTFSWVPREAGERTAPFGTHLYPIFSGGDDFLVVGAWDAVFEFARRVRAEFGAFVGHHPGVTLSASLQVVDPKESVARFAARADERLDEAKHASPEKNRVSVLGNVLSWPELEEAAALKRRLEILVKQQGESKALLQRIQQSATGYERLRDDAVRGRFRPERIWRLAYFLGRNAKPRNLPELREIAKVHERLLLDAFVHPDRARSPALFVVAGRWAELSSRLAPADAGRERTPSLHP